MDLETKVGRTFFGAWAVLALFQLAIVVGIVYAVVHFITKFW
jgi:hypothetical protein